LTFKKLSDKLSAREGLFCHAIQHFKISKFLWFYFSSE